MARAAEKRIDVVEDQVEDMQQDDIAQLTEAAQPTDIAAEDVPAADLVAEDVAQQDSVQSDDVQEVAARPEELRILEALLFASTEPLDQSALAKRMPDGVNVKKALEALQADYAMRGINLVRIANKW